MRLQIVFLVFIFAGSIFTGIPVANGQVSPFAYSKETLPSIRVKKGEPIQLDLGDVTEGLSPEQIARIIFPGKTRDILVFQDSRDPLKIAIIMNPDLTGLQIIPLRFEFKNGKKSDFFVAVYISALEDLSRETESPPRLIPFDKRRLKKKRVEEYIFFYDDAGGTQALDPESIKALLGNEHQLRNIGIQGNRIIVPLPEGILKGTTLRVFACSKGGIWAREGVARETPEGRDKKDFDWELKREFDRLPEKRYRIVEKTPIGKESANQFDDPYLSLAYRMTEPGSAIINFGEELTKEEKALFKRISRLIDTRKEHSSLGQGETISLSSEKDRLVFLKTDFSEKILCAFNPGDKESVLDLKLPALLEGARKARPLLKNGKAKIKGMRIHMELPPRSVEYFLIADFPAQ